MNQIFSELEVRTLNQVFSHTKLELKIIGTELCEEMQNTFWENIGNSGHSYVSYLLVFSMHSLNILFLKPLQLQYDYTQFFQMF